MTLNSPEALAKREIANARRMIGNYNRFKEFIVVAYDRFVSRENKPPTIFELRSETRKGIPQALFTKFTLNGFFKHFLLELLQAHDKNYYLEKDYFVQER